MAASAGCWAAAGAVADLAGPSLLIVWHSRTGASEALARAACAGAREAARGEGGNAESARLLPAAQATPEHFLAAAAYLFVCPENLGTMSGAMKEMFDRAYYPLLGRIEGRPYATIVAAGSDGHGAQAQIDRIVTGWRLRRVAEAVIVNLGAQTPAEILARKQVDPAVLSAAHDLGHSLAAGIQLGIF